ncbi:MAG: DUF1772 domain-containing protein [Balneolaceae bacterium]|nr:DUF1772 domain-containing protein [Balneolaceae bacterium]
MVQTTILILAGTTAALIAGLFFAWSCSVTPGLAQLSDRAYIAAMQGMNRAILNPLFFVCFFGTAILLPISTYLSYGIAGQPVFWLLLSATVLYLSGVMGVTIVGNVPLNNNLDAFDLDTSTEDEIAAQRVRFEGPWNRLNHLRTIASTATLVLFIIACLSY